MNDPLCGKFRAVSLMNGRITKTALGLIFFLAASHAQAQDVPDGKLGTPLGAYLRIEGSRVEGPKTAGRTLFVDSVNGQKLAKPIDVEIMNVDALPLGTRCILRGYEMGKMIGTPPAVEQAAKEEGRQIDLPQAGWKFHRYFVILSVIEPKELKKQ